MIFIKTSSKFPEAQVSIPWDQDFDSFCLVGFVFLIVCFFFLCQQIPSWGKQTRCDHSHHVHVKHILTIKSAPKKEFKIATYNLYKTLREEVRQHVHCRA